jgi:hypothetical protein
MDNIGVKITADASGVAPGVNTTKSEIGGLEAVVSGLNATFQALGAKIQSAFTGGAAAAKGMSEAVASVGVAAEAKIMASMEAVAALRAAMAGFAEVAIAAFAVHEVVSFINNMGEASQKIVHLSEQFGMSVTQVQQLQGVATATGISIDSLTRGMAFMDRNMANAAAGSKRMQQAFNAVGVSLNDGRDQFQKLEAVADKFKNMDDGPKKVALAMQLFGRSGKELIPVLNLGSAGIELLNQKLDEYGVKNADAVAKGEVLAQNLNESKLGFLGLGNVMTEALAPAFTELVAGFNDLVKAFIQSYQQGGLVYVIMQTIAAVIKVVVDVVELLGTIFKAVWDVIVEVITDIGHDFADIFGMSVPKNVNVTDQVLNVFKDTCIIVGDAIKIFVETVSLGFRVLAQIIITFGKIAYDALTLNWGAIAGDWQTGMNRVVNIVHEATKKIVDDAGEMAKAIQAAAQGKALGGTSGGVDFGKGSGDFDFTPSANKKTKKPKQQNDQMQLWRDDLDTQLLDEKNWGVDEAQFTEQFWAQKLATLKVNSKLWLQVHKEMLTAKKALFKEDQAEEIADIKMHEQIALDDVKTQTSIAKEGLNQQLELINEKEKLGQISSTKAVAQRNAVNKQLLQLDMQEADAEYNIKLQALQQELALEKLKPTERAAINRQIEVLERQHENQMLQMQAQYNAKVKAQNDALVNAYVEKWKSAIQPISSAMGNMFNQLITRQATFRQAAIQAMDSIVSSWISKGAEWLGNYIATQLGMRAANTATKAEDQATQTTTDATKLLSAQMSNAGQIASDAAVAAAAAFASTAAIPVVGPALAPEAAAGASAAVMAMVPLAFAEGGFDIPWGSNPLTQLHQEEMVLPAHIANPLRDLLASPFMLRGGTDLGGAAGRQAGATGLQTQIDNSRGDVRLYHQPHYPTPGPGVDMEHLLRTEGDRLIRYVKKAHRDGKFN